MRMFKEIRVNFDMYNANIVYQLQTQHESINE